MRYTLRVAEVLIALGSNVGDCLANLRCATTLLAAKITITAASDIYETAPMYVEDQPAFLNAVVLGQTELSPLALLAILKASERQVGREQRQENGPREIDLDLIAYGRLSYIYIEDKQPRLRVPHSKVAERRFVLQPAGDVAPDFILPGLGTVRALLDQTEDQRQSVKRLEHALLPIQRLE